MLALEYVGRQKTQDGIAGPVQNDAAVHHLGGDSLCKCVTFKIDSQHQTHPTNFGDDGMFSGEGLQLLLEVAADLLHVLEQVLALHEVDDGDGDCA